ncbi:hypothetical protein GGR56DRAFT_667245 [Xylariaceae sp. FL0804]|nr:hypothetical protein GGR56DRAFT_667245 [Xylariaceae sp. FL0804]
MCYQLVELYSACRCPYYTHAVDRCAAYGRPGHGITKRTILVGYACQEHSQVSSSVMGRCLWRRPPLLAFDFRSWIAYLYSFRPRPSNLSPSRQPSQLSFLFVGHDRLVSTSAPPALQRSLESGHQEPPA